MFKWFCDRCKKEIPFNCVKLNHNWSNLGHRFQNEIMLCSACAESFRDFLTRLEK